MAVEFKIYDKFGDELERLWKSIDVQNENPFQDYEINKIWFEIFGKSSKLKIFSDNKNFIAPMYFKEQVAYFCGGQDLLIIMI